MPLGVERSKESFYGNRKGNRVPESFLLDFFFFEECTSGFACTERDKENNILYFIFYILHFIFFFYEDFCA